MPILLWIVFLVGLLLVIGALKRVQHLIPNVYAGSCFVLASECRCIFKIANNPPIPKA